MNDTEDFRTAYSALRTQAASHSLTLNNMRMNNFLIQVAETIASERVQRRAAENAMHAQMERGKNG